MLVHVVERGLHHGCAAHGGEDRSDPIWVIDGGPASRTVIVGAETNLDRIVEKEQSVDVELLRSLLGRGIPVVTIEDHSIEGGFGSCVLDAANIAGLDARLVTRMALPDRWIYQGERKEQLAEVGLDPASIAAKAREIVAKATSGAERTRAMPLA